MEWGVYLMARYIDADVIKDELQGARIIKKPQFLNADEALFIIDNQPTADVEEVVRCENCKHIKVANSPTVYARCEKTKFLFESFQTDIRTHFCSFGERRGDTK